jgi:hypothetical protein
MVFQRTFPQIITWVAGRIGCPTEAAETSATFIDLAPADNADATGVYADALQSL